MRTVHEDIHGPFVKVDGSIFRPQVNSQFAYMQDVATIYKAGDKVRAHHISQTTRAKVGDELWFSHGHYYRLDIRSHKLRVVPSTECFRRV